MTHPFRSHNCGQLRENHVSQTVKLSGWIHTVRDHGGVLFLDLRDHYGITQIVVHPDRGFLDQLKQLHLESVVSFSGPVLLRSDDTINEKIPTGKVEIHASDLTVLNAAATVPFPIADATPVGESIRLKYRFLDLRRKEMQAAVILRSQVIQFLRKQMQQLNFLEIQTPILTASSPEGARDFLVPSRLHPGKCYALPQAPQQFKQLLMASGFDRYFQIAPCFRDEDARADRSPGEFYQLDLEMAFATQEEIFAVVETVLYGLFRKFSTYEIKPPPFQRITYQETLLTYGSDKPDLRNPLKMIDTTEALRDCPADIFKKVVAGGGVVRAIKVPGIADQPRKFFDQMVQFAITQGAKGLAYFRRKNNEIQSPLTKFFSQEFLESWLNDLSVLEGDVVFLIADSPDKAAHIGSKVIQALGKELNLLAENCFKFCWVIDYPMFERDSVTKKIQFSHNPFSMPQGGQQALENEDPLSILAYQYDLVCNGIELSSGAIRNHSVETMKTAFAIAGYDEEEVTKQFGALAKAFQYGAPPHGGIAPGIERMIMLIGNQKNIREVIPFPFNQKAEDLLMGAPSTVSPQQLRELGLRWL